MTRTAEDVGRGLAPARDARPIGPGTRIHVIGAAGAGASAAAILGARAGATVTGCDRSAASQYVPAVEAAGVHVLAGHDPRHVEGRAGAVVDRLAVTKALTAIDPDHPELVAARRLGIPIEAWQQVVADAAASAGARLVAVAGTHGKSTSSGWLVELLWRAGRDPGAFVGALLPGAIAGGIPSTARWGRGGEFVVEADEYAGNFDAYRPAVAVLLNAEWDHPDVFADEAAVFDAFDRWIRRSAGIGDAPPVLVVNVGDRGGAVVADRLRDWQGRLVVTRVEPDLVPGAGGRSPSAAADRLALGYSSAAGRATALVARVAHAGPEGTALELAGLVEAPSARISLPGRHNVQNALCVAAAAAVVGVAAPAILEGLASFRGVGRRLELKGEPGGVAILDDYAHHPTAIAETLRAVRQRYPGRRLWAVYEPLTFHRTAALLDRFAEVLAAGADAVAIAEIWAGRDPDTTIASADALAAAVRARGLAQAAAPGSVEETADWLADRVARGDVVLVMGGGRSYRIAERLVETLRTRRNGGTDYRLGRVPNLTHGDADDLLARLKTALESRDVDAAMELYAPDADVRDDPFADHVTGELAIRERWNAIAAERANVEFDVERAWASGGTALAAWHGAWTQRESGERIRARGFLTLEVDDDGRIVRERHWTIERVVGTDATFRPEPRGASGQDAPADDGSPQDAGGR